MDSYNNKNNSGYEDFEAEAGNRDLSSENKFSKERIIEALKKPKNILILVSVIIFIVVSFSKLTSPKAKKEAKLEQQPTEERIPEPLIVVTQPEAVPVVEASQPTPAPSIAPPSLPSLDINLIGKLDSLKNVIQTETEEDDEDEISNLDLEKLRKELQAESEVTNQPKASDLSFDEFAKKDDKVKRKRRVDPDNPPPPILNGLGLGPEDKTSRKNLSDFIFIDSSLDAELSNEVPNEGKKIADLGNIIAQGRMIDAILETAINSAIPGTIRAIVSRDVYAEAGRSILIPKGTRLYGTYSAGGAKSGRLIITWSRILRPDGISLGIDSFASDQFGRAGVQGDVDKKYGEIITSALLLSSIPLVATIATQQITGSKGSQVTITTADGITTTETDAVNRATERFTDEIARATEEVVKNLIDTGVVITISQGTRIKVMVNRDIKLPRYKPLTSLNTTVTNSSQ